MPNDRNTTIICPVHSNIRTYNALFWNIFLLNVTYKIYTNLLAKYIEPYAEQSIGD